MPSPLSLVRRLVASGALVAALALPAASASAQSCLNCTVQPGPWAGQPPIQILTGTNLIQNGGFENPNAVNANGFPVWSRSLGANYTILTPSGIIHPHCSLSPGAMYLPGFSGIGPATTVRDAGAISQQLSIPAAATGTTLDFSLYFPNQLQEHEELVVKAVDVNNLPDPFSTDPIPWVTLSTSSNLTTSKNAWVHVGPLPMAQFAGATIWLRFQARTDQQYPEPSQIMPVVTPNGIYLDDVAMWTPGQHLMTLCI